jgi:hypothetical protein
MTYNTNNTLPHTIASQTLFHARFLLMIIITIIVTAPDSNAFIHCCTGNVNEISFEIYVVEIINSNMYDIDVDIAAPVTVYLGIRKRFRIMFNREINATTTAITFAFPRPLKIMLLNNEKE